MARADTPPDLDAAGYSIVTMRPGDLPQVAGLVGRFWWIWANNGDLDGSPTSWATAEEVVADARRDMREHNRG